MGAALEKAKRPKKKKKKKDLILVELTLYFREGDS